MSFLRNHSATWGYYLAFITLGLTAAVTGPTLPGLAERTHSRLDEISILFAVRSFGYLAGALVNGRAFDRFPGHPILAFTLVVIAAAMAVIPSIPVLWLLAALLLVVGLAESAVDVGGNSLLIWRYGGDVSPWMNALHFCFGLGAFIAPVIVARVVLVMGEMDWAYRLIALLILPGAVWLSRLPSPPRPASHHDVSLRVSRPGTVLLIAGFIFLYAGAETGMGGWLYTYATTLGLNDAATAAWLTALFWGSLTAGRLVGIPLSRRFQPRTILVWDMLVCMACATLMLVWSAQFMVVLWLGAIGTGLGMASIYPTVLAFAERRMTITGAITGWVSLGAGAGVMLVPWLIGQFFERVGPQVTMTILFVDQSLALVLLFILLFGVRSRKSLA